MRYSLKTDKGVVRMSNQDCCFLTVFDEKSCFAVVCDGMGGPKAGDIASQIAVKNVSERFVAGWRSGISAASVKNLLTTAVSAANICVYDASVANEEYQGMGTTLVAAVVLGDELIIANVGDSRAYLAGSGLKLLTKDHSLVQELVDKGELSESDAKVYPYKNVITRALGIEEHIEIDFFEYKIDSDSCVLLCSDGLTNFVSEDEIFDILKNNDIGTVSEKLVETANGKGGGDNITAVVFAK